MPFQKHNGRSAKFEIGMVEIKDKSGNERLKFPRSKLNEKKETFCAAWKIDNFLFGDKKGLCSALRPFHEPPVPTIIYF